MKNKRLCDGIIPNRIIKSGWCICGLLALLVLQSCGINDSTSLFSKQIYTLSTVNDVQVTKDREAGIIGGMIKLHKNGKIERELSYRMQDGSDQKNVYEGTYEIDGNELKIEFKESSGYRWTPPNAKIEGATLTFYNPCVNCFGPAHEEVYVRRLKD
ncbi:MAG: hypothetical protein JJU46_00105 [Balneolaceae bacterium]|nr:hypothetical protein [Balneolaceae bacterium]MCH8549428.1 hypothetical protein [Balneolaceae bacterium]